MTDQSLDLPGGNVGVEDEELEDEDGSINQAMQIIGQTIMTEDGEELHIIENAGESLVTAAAQESQQVVLLHQGISDSQLNEGSSQIEEEFVSQELRDGKSAHIEENEGSGVKLGDSTMQQS